MSHSISIPDTPEELLQLLKSRYLSTEELRQYTEKISPTPACFKVKTTVLDLLNKFNIDINIFPKEILNIKVCGEYVKFKEEEDPDTNHMLYMFTTKVVDRIAYKVVIEPDNSEECLSCVYSIGDRACGGEFYNAKGELLPIEI